MSAGNKAEAQNNPGHSIPLWGLFLALVALTAAEVALFEVWHATAMAGDPFIPKVAMVLILIIVLTLPKAAIVMIYFMHIKFEKLFIVCLAIIPLIFASIALLPTLTDIVTLRKFSYTEVEGLRDYRPGHHDEAEDSHQADAPAQRVDSYGY